MKKILVIMFLLITIFGFVIIAEAAGAEDWMVKDLNGLIDPIKTPEQILVDYLMGEGVQASNVKFSGAQVAAGTFATTTNIIGFNQGIILSSGDVRNVIGPNAQDGITGDNMLQGDSELDTLIPGYTTNDATYLEFDFIPNSDYISFQYVFASDEYNEYTNTQYNDVFGFFLNGENVAKLPGSNVAVSINNVNGGNPYGTNASNSLYYVHNDLSDGAGSINTEMDGMTTVLSVYAPVKVSQINHIKLAIADAGDHILDSNVFIKAGSFTDKPNNSPLAVNDTAKSDGSSINIDVLANDLDIDGDILMVTDVTQPGNGLVSIESNGKSINYTPNPDFIGLDTFKYVVNDGKGATSIAEVSVLVDKQTEPSISGFMTGGGSIFTNEGKRVTHGFTLHSLDLMEQNSLQVNWGKGNKFHMNELNSIQLSVDNNIEAGSPIAGFNTFTGTGIGTYNGQEGASIEFIFTDAGEPGKGDYAKMIIKDQNGNIVYSVSGNLNNGNHQAHRITED